MNKETILTINLFILSFLALSINFNSSVWADNINPGVFSINSKPYGLTYEQWGYKLWQWFISLPEDKNPLIDDTGERCANGQSGPVWFLTGTSSGIVKRSCTIPNDKAILISVAGNSCSYTEYPDVRSESGLRKCAIAGNQVTSLEVTIDGRKLKGIRTYHVTSHLFDENFPENNLWDERSGPTKAVYDSYFLILEPMSPGKHEIRFAQITLDTNPFLPGEQKYTYDVTYYINIV